MAVDFSGEKSMNAGPDFHSDDQKYWSSSESTLNGFGSSDLGTPVESELDSAEAESDYDDGFMADLSRQMSDYMLDDDKDDQDFPYTNPSHWGNRQNLTTSRGGREKSESTQWFKPSQHLLQPGGSGMKAVYLGSGESRITSTGTGVFLPRVNNPVAFQPPGQKTSRCSTVLIPARVLQVLEQHFKNVDDTSTLIHSNAGPAINSRLIVGPDDVYRLQMRQSVSQTRPTIKCDNENIQLPQEWTYY